MLRRGLVRVLSVLSGLLCVATVLVWTRPSRGAGGLTIQRAHYRQARTDEEDAQNFPYRGRRLGCAILFDRGSIAVQVERSLKLNLGRGEIGVWKDDWPEGTRVIQTQGLES